MTKTAYATKGAVGIFHKLHADLRPEGFYEKRRAAATALVHAVEEAARAAGLEAGVERGAMVVSLTHCGFMRLGVSEKDGRPILVRGDPPEHKRPEEIPLKIEYDPATEMFVGTDPDGEIAPAPGQPIPRKSAVAVLAEVIAEAIRAQHGETRRAR